MLPADVSRAEPLALRHYAITPATAPYAIIDAIAILRYISRFFWC